MGYSVSWGDFKLIPLGGVGVGVSSKAKGDVIKDDSTLATLSSLDIYNDKLSAYAFGGLSIERMVGRSWVVGLSSRIESSRGLTTIVNEHTIRPFDVRLRFGYVW